MGSSGAPRLHRPDFAVKAAGHIRWILEAKAPGESLDKHFGQAHDYCKAINGSYSRAKPVQYFLLTNGLETRIFEAEARDAVLTLTFQQCVDGNPNFRDLQDRLRPDAFNRGAIPATADTIHFVKPSFAEVNHVFARCHRLIHQSDHISQAKGFEEFVKLVTLKLLSDKEVRENFPGVFAEKRFDHPAANVTSSLRWIKQHEFSAPNPVDSILFREFMDGVEKEIARRLRKRFFAENERLQLKPETIRGVVRHLESLFLFGIDADLNGQLFENFLSATMRGKDLGQYFTPRTLVKLGVGLGDLQTTDSVLDGCCGTGGFLIDALADMWRKVNGNVSLSNSKKATQRMKIAHEQLYGMDFGEESESGQNRPAEYVSPRDGGSRVFNVDALDLQIRDDLGDTPEETVERDELRHLGLPGKFDVVLTNPPFSKMYERAQEGDAWVLDQYAVAKGREKVMAKLMFFEMYHHYLRPGGRLVSVIDDGFLNGKSYKWFRDMLRTMYTVKAVVYLPGDAFQRSDARVKTSFIVMEKRDPKAHRVDDEQPAVFMYAVMWESMTPNGAGGCPAMTSCVATRGRRWKKWCANTRLSTTVTGRQNILCAPAR